MLTPLGTEHEAAELYDYNGTNGPLLPFCTFYFWAWFNNLSHCTIIFPSGENHDNDHNDIVFCKHLQLFVLLIFMEQICPDKFEKKKEEKDKSLMDGGFRLNLSDACPTPSRSSNTL